VGDGASRLPPTGETGSKQGEQQEPRVAFAASLARIGNYDKRFCQGAILRPAHRVLPKRLAASPEAYTMGYHFDVALRTALAGETGVL